VLKTNFMFRCNISYSECSCSLEFKL
jgi:hypothetical protein